MNPGSEEKEGLLKDPALKKLTAEFQELTQSTPPEDLPRILAERESNLQQEIQRLRELATKDLLTGLDNRRSFDEEIHRAIASAIRTGESVSLLLLDLDTLKQTNDTVAHQAGDALLKNVAEAIISKIRPNDRAFRWGGDEFAVILLTTDKNGAIGVGERLRQAVEVLDSAYEGTRIKATTSIGVSSFRPVGIDPKQDNNELITSRIGSMMADADKALYIAKGTGKNRVGFQGNNGTFATLEPNPNKPYSRVAVYREQIAGK